jgi:Sulfotransferase family
MNDKAFATIVTDPFFIVGVQRSGTTMLRLMLDRHGLIAIPPETSGMIPDIYARRASFGREARIEDIDAFEHVLRSNPGFHRWGISIDEVHKEIKANTSLAGGLEAAYIAYAHAHGKRIWGDKTPRYLGCMPLLARLFPRARFIHLIRDGRDVALSQLGLHRLHRHSASVAFMWRRKIQAARAAGQSLGEARYAEIHYERLLTDTADELDRLCAFLHVPFDPAMMSHDVDAVQEELAKLPMTARAQHQNLKRPPIGGLRDWRTQMTSKEVADFEAIAREGLVQTGYALSCPHVGPVARSRAWLHVLAFATRSIGYRIRSGRRERRQWRDPSEPNFR